MTSTDPNQPPIPISEPPAPDTTSSAQYDAAEFEALRAEAAQARAILERLSPHAELIKRIVENDDDRDLAERAWKSRDEFIKSQQPQVPEEFKPIYEKVSRLDEFVSKYEKAQEEAATAPQREFASKYQEWQASPVNDRFYRRLVADHPEIKARDVQYLAQVAAENNFEPLEETWKREGWRFAAQQANSTPPSSLRTDAGDIGIPGASKPPADQGVSMRDRIISLERGRRGALA